MTCGGSSLYCQQSMDGVVHSYKYARVWWSLPFPAVATLAPRTYRPSRAPKLARPTRSIRHFVRHVRLAHSRICRSAPDLHMFRHATPFAISVRRSEPGGHWRGGSKKGILRQASRMEVASSVYSSSSAHCLAALGMSPICEQAGGAGFTVSGRIVTGPIGCIVTSTDWCASSGTNSATAGQLLSLSRAQRSCDGSGRSCQKMVGIASHPLRSSRGRSTNAGIVFTLGVVRAAVELQHG